MLSTSSCRLPSASVAARRSAMKHVLVGGRSAGPDRGRSLSWYHWNAHR